METEVAAQAGRLFQEWYVAIVVGIMLAAGVLGGLVNYYLARLESPAGSETVTRGPRIIEALVIGIAAAFLVPLFLRMISSELLTGGRSDPLELFVFAGFCLIAAISSRAFIGGISDRVLREAQEARVEAQAARSVAATATGEAQEARKGAILAYNAAERAQREALEAQGQAGTAEQKAEFALSGELLLGDPALEGAVARSAQPDVPPEDRLRDLVESYNNLQASRRSTGDRTSEQNRIFRQMTALVPYLQEAFPIEQYLASPDNAGLRLAAYAYLYQRPDVTRLESLVDSVVDIETQPFGQYWGILTVQRVLARSEQEMPGALREKLERLLHRLTPGSDRYYELSKVLQQEL